MIENLEIRRGLFETTLEFQQLVELQNVVYKERGISFTVEDFKRWYIENPFGKAISFNAFDGGKMVAHYVCIPTKMIIDGRVVNGIKSMATVTHPDYRGKGLFKTLAKKTYNYARDWGYEFVIGVANANSFPGFMKYFPFTFVSQLNVKIGWGTRFTKNEHAIFSSFWDVDSLNWRRRCGAANYNRHKNCIIGRYNLWLNTCMGCFSDELLTMANIKEKRSIKPLLYIGIGSVLKSPYFSIPKFIKHSPFNLIFMDLTDGTLPKMTKDNVFFQLFDFDVA